MSFRWSPPPPKSTSICRVPSRPTARTHLLSASIRLASELSTGHALADRVRAAIEERV